MIFKTYHGVALGAIFLILYLSYVATYYDSSFAKTIRKVSLQTFQNAKTIISIDDEYNVTDRISDIPPSSSDREARRFYTPGFMEPNPKVCENKGEGLKVIALVISAPSNFKARMAIRETWGHFTNRRDVSIAFFIGTTNDEDIYKRMLQENYLYSDMIFARFYEKYDNLTLKTIAMLQWTTEYCLKAKFLLKTDDDMYINMDKLLQFIDAHMEDTNAIFGRLAQRWPPIRDSNNKYYVGVDDFSGNVYPNFLTGPSYLLPAVLAPSLFKAALNEPYIKLEDVFMTGIVAEKLNIKRIDEAGFQNIRVKMEACTVQRVISIHMVEFKEQFDIWKKLMDETSNC